MMRSTVLLSSLMLLALAGCGSEPEPPQFGPNPTLPEPKRGLLPSMVISKPAAWGDERPTVPEGYTIQAIATDLMIPRQTLVLPNGDILVAEGSGGNAPVLRPKDLVAGYIKALGKSSVKGGILRRYIRRRRSLRRPSPGDAGPARPAPGAARSPCGWWMGGSRGGRCEPSP